MALVVKILKCLAIVSAAILFAAALDVGHFGLKKMIEPFAAGPLALFFLLSVAAVFLGSGGGGGASGTDDADGADADEKIAEFQAKMNSRMAALQTTVESFTCQDRETLEEENRQLKEQLEAIKQAEREKVESDAESLRKRNEELEEQIKQWAIDAVGNTISEAATSEEAA